MAQFRVRSFGSRAAERPPGAARGSVLIGMVPKRDPGSHQEQWGNHDVCTARVEWSTDPDYAWTVTWMVASADEEEVFEVE